MKKIKTHPLSSHSANDWWDKISDAEKKSIKNGITQLKQGNGITHAEVRKKVDLLLEKQHNTST